MDAGYANVGTTGLGTAPAERVRPPPGLWQSSGSGAASHERRASTGGMPTPTPASPAQPQRQPQPQAQPPTPPRGPPAGSPQQQHQQMPPPYQQQQQPPMHPQQQPPQRPVCPTFGPCKSRPFASLSVCNTVHTDVGLTPEPGSAVQAQQQRQQQPAPGCNTCSHAASPQQPARPPPSNDPPHPQTPSQPPQPAPPPFSTAPIVTRSGAFRLQLQVSPALYERSRYVVA